MKIKVKFLDGNDIHIEIDTNNILELKKLIADNKDILDKNIKLIYRGKVLKNEDTFEIHKIDENSTLHCVVRKISNTQNNTFACNQEDGSNLVSNQDTSNNIPLNNISSSNAGPNITNFQHLFQNMNLSNPNPNPNPNPTDFQNLLQNINSPNTIEQINSMYQIPQFRELVISNTLNRMNLPIDSPFRHVIENNISTLLQNPQMTSQIIGNINNLNNNENSNNENSNNENNNILNSFMESLNNLDSIAEEQSINENNQTSQDTTINLEELKEKYSGELEEIKNMGFDNEELILKTLDQSQGSVVISINKLLN